MYEISDGLSERPFATTRDVAHSHAYRPQPENGHCTRQILGKYPLWHCEVQSAGWSLHPNHKITGASLDRPGNTLVQSEWLLDKQVMRGLENSYIDARLYRRLESKSSQVGRSTYTASLSIVFSTGDSPIEEELVCRAQRGKVLTDNKIALHGKSIVRIGVWQDPKGETGDGGYETHMWAELTKSEDHST